MCQRFVNYTVQRSLSCFFPSCMPEWLAYDRRGLLHSASALCPGITARYRKVFNQAGGGERSHCASGGGKGVQSGQGGESGQVYATKQSQPFCHPAHWGCGLGTG
jgi:hypothetical protein